jgi:hypothetical protein
MLVSQRKLQGPRYYFFHILTLVPDLEGAKHRVALGQNVSSGPDLYFTCTVIHVQLKIIYLLLF